MPTVGSNGACLCVAGLQGERVGLCRRGQTDRRPAYPAPTIPPSTVREGPNLDGPGKEWLDRERLRMDSESLDEEES